MKERLYIDNIDAYERWGVFVAFGGHNGLFQYPKPKSYETNNWHELDGEELDNRKFVYESRQITINFCCNANESKYNEFVSFIMSSVYHDFEFRVIGYSVRLRYSFCSSYQYGKKFGVFTFVFYDDNAFLDESFRPTITQEKTLLNEYDSINDVNLSTIGVKVIGKHDNNLRKTAGVKDNLSVSYEYEDGTEYGETEFYKKQKNSNVEFLITGKSKSEFWNNYRTFFWLLNCIDETANHKCKWQSLRLKSTPNVNYSICYVNNTVTDVFIDLNGGVYVKISIELKIQESKNDDLTFLTSEDGFIIVTENNYTIEI